jgi:beta-propeller repeat-containing protein
MRSLMGLLLLAAAPGFAAQREGSLPVFFFPNAGETDPSIRFMAETPELHAGFRADSAVFQIQGGDTLFHTQVVRFAGANPHATIEGAGVLAGKANFFLGQDADRWKTGLPTYRKIVYRNLYPGIDMSYSGNGRRIKSEFIVSPGANPDQVRLEYGGAERISISENGDLAVGGRGAEFREEAPLVYQNLGPNRVRVEARYRLVDAYTAGFELGQYDPSKILVIDPVVSYSTYLGGTSTSAVTGLAVDSSGDLYATGWTAALDFPIAGAAQAANQGGVDAFVVKLNAAGTALIYATYIGGRSADQGAGIAVDSSGQAYVTGFTASTDFPLVSPIRTTLGGSRNAFALKLNAAGNLLVYSTYLGGTNYDMGNAIAVDASGNAYIAGDTQSANFPVTSGAFQTLIGGAADAFVTKLTSSGAISYSTFLGGASAEHAGGIAIDSSGNAYVAGGTFSSNFPLANPVQSGNGGGEDAFVTKLNSTGTAILYSTYLGGNGGTVANPEQANAIAVDASGNAYVAGVTNSSNFPVSAGAFQTAFDGVQNAFISKIGPTGNTLVYSTYLGGSSFDWAAGIGVGSNGAAYVAGYTSSADFPTAGSLQSFTGLYKAFIAELSASGNTLAFSTYFGGTGIDVANAMALDSNGNIFAGGETSSTNLPLQTPLQSANNGGSAGWLLRLGVTAPPAQLPAVNSVTPPSGTGNSVTFTAVFSDPAGASSLTNVSLLVNNSASLNSACYVTYSPAANQFTLADDVASSGSNPVVPGGGSAQNDQCTLNGAGSTATLSATTLTLTISLTFQPGFEGGKGVYLYAASANANTGWVALGAWTATIPPAQPSVGSVSPNGSTGSSQTFNFVFSDSQDVANIADVAMLFAPSLVYQNACYVVYDAVHGLLQLASNNATGSSEKSAASTGTLENSQCSVGATTVAISGNSLILSVSITFQGAFSGLQNIYLYAVDANGDSTGWVQSGTYTVAAGGVPVANSVVPSSGFGSGQRFTFTISDQGGSGYLTDLEVVIGTSTSNLNNSCVLLYDRTQNMVSLVYDNPSHGVAELAPGSSSVISNSQCSLLGPATTVAYGVTSMVVTMDIVFNADYSGAKNIYLYAAEPNANSGWTTVGTWTVTGGSPTANSVSPPSGAGGVNPSVTFTMTVADSATYENLSGLAALFTTGAPSNLTNACIPVYLYPLTVGLYANDGVTLNTKGLGSSSTLQNSQCAVGFTSAAVSGTTLTFTVEILFNSSFDGAKTVYLEANEPSTSSGWVSRGVWTVQ